MWAFLIWALLAILGAARCTCRGVSTGNMATDTRITPSFLDYTSQECEKACCDFPGCVGFQRPLNELNSALRGQCTLFKSGNSALADSGTIFVTIANSSSTCEVANEILGKSCAPVSVNESMTRAQCQLTCCGDPLCTRYSVAIAGPSPCKICHDSGSPSDGPLEILVEVSKCRQQPESPEPLPCSRGDPRKGLTITSATMSNSTGGATKMFPEAFDGNVNTLANVDAKDYDSLYVDLGSTKLVGIVSIVAPRKLVTEANSIDKDLPDGFILMVGDYDDCKSFANNPPQCPVCGTVNSVSGNSLYEIDCRGLRGRYVHIFGPNDEASVRKLHFSGVVGYRNVLANGT